jgi:hypothetical protein
MNAPQPRAFEVFYGNSLSVICRDEGLADKHVRDLHGYGLQALYPLTPEQIEYLATMPAKGPTSCAPPSSPPPP